MRTQVGVDHQVVIESVRVTRQYAATARLLGVSRERIRQIVGSHAPELARELRSSLTRASLIRRVESLERRTARRKERERKLAIVKRLFLARTPTALIAEAIGVTSCGGGVLHYLNLLRARDHTFPHVRSTSRYAETSPKALGAPRRDRKSSPSKAVLRRVQETTFGTRPSDSDMMLRTGPGVPSSLTECLLDDPLPLT